MTMAAESPSSLSRLITLIKSHPWLFFFLISVLLALLGFQIDDFDPAAFGAHDLTRDVINAPRSNPRMLEGSEIIGSGLLPSPEDLDYDPDTNVIYTTCSDGFIKKVEVAPTASESIVQNFVNTGGRPLGLVRGHDNDLIVADVLKGLIRITQDGKIELLTDQADGVKFKLINAVDIAEDGVIYFSDSSYKYGLKDFMWDYYEGRPHGRLMSYDPATKQTRVLLSNLYVANGVAVHPSQEFVIVCEPLLRRCKKVYVKGEKKGSVGMFIEKMPGMPDNIRYDKDGHFWVALASEMTDTWYMILKYPFIRKVLGIMLKFNINLPNIQRNGGALSIDLEGKPVAHFHQLPVYLIASVLKISDVVYFGSVINPYLLRLNITEHPAQLTTSSS